MRKDFQLELQNGFERNDEKKIEETINDYYQYYDEVYNTEEIANFYEYEYVLMRYLYDKIINEGLPRLNININFYVINMDLLEYIITPYWMDLTWSFNDNTLKKVSENDLDETVEENLFTEMKSIAEAYAFFLLGENFTKQFLEKLPIQFIEEKLKNLSNLIMISSDYHIQPKQMREINSNYDQELYKKFKGNSLQKRKGNRIKLYENVAKTIKILEDEYNFISGVQRRACEMFGVEPSSYSKWKNVRIENQKLVEKWVNSISNDEKEKLKKLIIGEIKK